MHGTYNQSSAGSIGSNGGLSRQNSRSQSSSFTTTRSGQLSTTATLTGHNSIPKEFDDGLIRCEQDLQDDIKWLLRATHQYDQVMSASRRAHQRLSSECKRKIEEVIGKFIAQERICEVGRREALDQLERSLGNWSIESDITAFIKEHSDNDMNESLVLSSQALSILTDTVTRTTMPISISPGPLLAPISRQVSGQTINVRSSSPIKPSSSWNTTAAAAASTKVDDEYYHTSGDERAVSVDTASVSSTHVSSSQDTISNMGDSASKPTGSKWEALMSFQYFTPKYSKQKAGSANIVTPTPIATTPPATSTDTSINTSVCDKNSKSATSSLLHSTLLRSTLLPLSENDSETASVQGTEMGTYPTAIITSSEDGNDEVSNAVSTNLITSAPASPNKERHSPTKRLSKVLDEERIALATYSQRSHSGEGVGTHSLRTTPPYLLPAKDSATINKDGLSNIEPNSQNSVSPMVVYALEEDSFDLQALAAAVDTHLSTIFFAVIEETAVATSTATAAATQVITQDSSTKKSAISPRDTNTGRNSTSASANVPTITLTKQRKNSLNSSKTDSQKATSQKSVTSSNSQKSTVENTYPAHIQSAVTELCNLLQTTFGRDKFAQGLNQFRSRKVELSVGFEPLGDVLYHALSLCEVHHDVHCAKVIMMLSQTFYRDQLESFIPSQTSTLDTSSVPTSPMQRIKPKESSSLSSSIHSAKSPKSPLISQKDEMQMKTQRQQRNESISSEPSTARSIHLQERSSRVYLKEILVDHPIWKKKEFWEQILWDCVLDQV